MPAVIAAMGIVSPGMIADAQDAVDGWLKVGVPFVALVDAATKSRGKKNPVAYMRSVIKPELEKIAKAKAEEAERKRQAEQGPDWEDVMRTWARTGNWPYAIPGVGAEPWRERGVKVPPHLLEKYKTQIEMRRDERRFFTPAADQGVGF